MVRRRARGRRATRTGLRQPLSQEQPQWAPRARRSFVPFGLDACTLPRTTRWCRYFSSACSWGCVMRSKRITSLRSQAFPPEGRAAALSGARSETTPRGAGNAILRQSLRNISSHPRKTPRSAAPRASITRFFGVVPVDGPHRHSFDARLRCCTGHNDTGDDRECLCHTLSETPVT